MSWKRSIAVVLALMALSAAVQAVVICRATTPERDAIRFVESARAIDREGLLRAIRVQREQPLFPAWVWAVHAVIQSATGDFPSIWAVSVQVGAAIPLVLAVVPLFFFLQRVVDEWAATIGVLFFCVVAPVARLGANGLSDSTHLLFFIVAMWMVAEYLRDGTAGRDPAWLFGVGIATGLAALSRAEGLVLVPALLLALATFQFHPPWRQTWGRLTTAGGALLLGLAAVPVPYLMAVGAADTEAVAGRLLGRFEGQVAQSSGGSTAAGVGGDWRLPDGRAMDFRYKEKSESIRFHGLPAACAEFGKELAEAFGYWLGPLALFGLWRMRNVAKRPLDRFLQVFFVLFAVVALAFAVRVGYLSDRHLLPLLVVGLGAAGWGSLELGRAVRRGFSCTFSSSRASPIGGTALTPALSQREREPDATVHPAAAWLVVLLVAGVCLARTLKPLHTSRTTHAAAARWLAQQTDVPGPVLDTCGWTALYSGRETYRYDDAPDALADPRLAYVVVEQRELEYDSDRSRTLKHVLQNAAEPVARFTPTETDSARSPKVLVFRWRTERFAWLVSHPMVATRSRAGEWRR